LWLPFTAVWLLRETEHTLELERTSPGRGEIIEPST
jgi:hypothetical protein